MITTDISALASSLMRGRVVLEASVLKQLRHSRQLSQEELANECSLRHFRVSISSIKRAETSKPVLFRIARELARFFNVPAERLICGSSSSERAAEVGSLRRSLCGEDGMAEAGGPESSSPQDGP